MAINDEGRMAINDGGPAFPNNWGDSPSQGMTLRDWLVGQVLSSIYLADAAIALREAAIALREMG